MRIKSILSCSASRKMLRRYRNALWRHTLCASLDSWDDMIHNLINQLRILPESTVSPLPSGVCHHICHIHIPLAQTTGIPFSADTVCELICNFNPGALYCCRNPHRPRPGGKSTHRIIHTKDHFTIFIPGIRSYADRNKMLTLFCHCVELIHPVCQIFRGRICP